MEIKKIDIADSDYPEALKHIQGPPQELFVAGELLEEDKNAIAIVGTRQASFYGISEAERFAYELGLLGITIVSGMAKGIDAASHRGAIKAGARTIAVMGAGHDKIYPPEHKKLYEEILKNGAVITEFPVGTELHPSNFPSRNRIISGLSKGVLVIDAPSKSGALITARFALEQGREVFAVPGNINSAKSAGSNRLIKDGAKLVENTDDILEELLYVLDIEAAGRRSQASGCRSQVAGCRSQASGELSQKEGKVYGILCDNPLSIDEIRENINLPVNEVSGILLSLELKKLVKALPGENFIKV
ncbi:MAG: DNA-protecting protein DprA [Candidatus Omnitrophica bacterium]|nr:DNA-protecting protein DprA [Candidatus Omnitrophota bacterium]